MEPTEGLQFDDEETEDSWIDNSDDDDWSDFDYDEEK